MFVFHGLIRLLPKAVLVAGVGLVVAQNLRQWQRDKSLAERLKSERTPIPELAATPKVSVLVAAWNEGPEVEEIIESFKSLKYGNKEMVVCAGGRDDTYERALKYGGDSVVVLPQLPGEGKQGALRKCFERATGEIIFLTDADCALEDDGFIRTLAMLVNEGEDVATGVFRPPKNTENYDRFTLYQWFWNTYTVAGFSEYMNGMLGTNAAVRRSAVEKSGAFKSSTNTGTDYLMAKELIEAGYRIRCAKYSELKTSYPQDYSSYLKQQSRWIKNIVLLGTKFGSFDEVASALKTSLLGLGMLLFPLTFPITRSLGISIWMAAMLYGYLSRLRAVKFGEAYTGVKYPLIGYPWLFLYMLGDFFVWAYSLVEYLSPGLRRRW